MTPETVLKDAAENLRYARSIGLYRGHLCYWDGKLQAHNRQHTTTKHPVFFIFEPPHITVGLSTEEWSALKTNLWNFYKEKI